MEKSVSLPLTRPPSLGRPSPRPARQNLELGRFLLAGSLAAALSLPSTASANGRFPRAQRLIEDPKDAQHLVLGATFGLLVTTDRGSSWHHVCEKAYGETDLSIDALTALTSRGALLAGIYSGVSRAATSACDFRRTLGTNNREAVPDFAVSPDGRAVAIMVSLLQDGSTENQLYGSSDDGDTWQAIGALLPAELAIPLTVDLAASDAKRVYISGLGDDDTGVLLRSDDGGESFQVLPIPTEGALGEYPYIAAVDALDADQLYVRTDFWAYDAAAGVAYANDALLYSSDGGASFSELLRQGGKLLGFAFSPDGQELVVGYGDPLEAGGLRLTDPGALGIYRAPKASSDFEQRYTGSVGCLTWSAEGLYACTHEVDTGFTLGLAADADFTTAAPPSFEPLLRLGDVVGPLECDGCSAGAVCRNYWYSVCQGFGQTDCQELSPAICQAEGGAGGEAAGGSPDSGAPGSKLGSAGAPLSAHEGGTRSVLDAPALEARGGCDCRVGARSTAASGWWLAALAACVRGRRRSAGARRR